VGYGYYPLTAVVWLLATLGIAFALIATHTTMFVPTSPAAAATTAVTHTGTATAAMTRGRPVLQLPVPPT
jgi:hypothetical protein